MQSEKKDKTIITTKRVFNYSVEKVFEAFLNPLHIKEWFGPKEFTNGRVMLTPEAGGNIDIEMITPKGTIWMKGVFTEIILYKKIEYRFRYVPDTPDVGESLVCFYFSSNGNETEVELVQTIFKFIGTEGRTKGWEAGFDKIEILLQNI